MLQVHVIPCLKDNYAYLIENPVTKEAWVVDPSEAGPVRQKLQERGLTLRSILNTHHHWDHVGGNLELKTEYRAPITCSSFDQPRIDEADRGLSHGDTLRFGESTVRVIEIPGHTLGHIAFYFENENYLFTGDTLFSAGCGRLFEGTSEQMFTSLQTLAQLPDQTQIFCGHEYTLENLRFALHVEPGNHAVDEHSGRVRALRAAHHPSIPSTLALEKSINVFVRAKSAGEFKALREAKDHF